MWTTESAHYGTNLPCLAAWFNIDNDDNRIQAIHFLCVCAVQKDCRLSWKIMIVMKAIESGLFWCRIMKMPHNARLYGFAISHRFVTNNSETLQIT